MMRVIGCTRPKVSDDHSRFVLIVDVLSYYRCLGCMKMPTSPRTSKKHNSFLMEFC